MALKSVVFLYCLAVANAGVIGTAYAPTSAESAVFSPFITKSVSPAVTKTVTPLVSKTLITPGAPVYESILTTHESNHKSSDGSSFSKTLDTSYSEINKFESRPLSQIYGVPSVHPVARYGESSLLGHRVLPVINSVSPSVVYPSPSPALTNAFYHHDAFSHVAPLNTGGFPVVIKSISAPGVVTSPVLTKTVTPILKKTEIVTPVLTAHVTPVLKTVTPVVTKTISPAVYNPHVVTSYTAPVLKKVVSPATNIQTAPEKTAVPYSDAHVVSHMSFNGLGASYAW